MSGGISQSTASIAQEIAAGRLHAHEKHGENSIEAVPADDPRWLSILVEEVGEAAHTLTYDAVGLADMVTGEPLSSAEVGYDPATDELVDLFPGSGRVSAAAESYAMAARA